MRRLLSLAVAVLAAACAASALSAVTTNSNVAWCASVAGFEDDGDAIVANCECVTLCTPGFRGRCEGVSGRLRRCAHPHSADSGSV